jgi:prepilin-type processing-associated H-X9-DG protein
MAAAGAVVFALAILFPVASTARSDGKSALCLANLHILGRVWTAYPDDNDGRIVGGSNYYYNTGHGTPWRWVEVPLLRPTDDPDKEGTPLWSSDLKLEYFLNGIKAGNLYPYVNNTAVYHCPSDRNFLIRPNTDYRSYDIAGLMNGEDFVKRTGWPGQITEYRVTSVGDTGHVLIDAETVSQIAHPSVKYVFVEARGLDAGQTCRLGSYVLLHGAWESWWDTPAVFHGDTATFGFADGHVGFRRWTDPRTIWYLNKGGTSGDMIQPNNPDIQWMVNGYLAGE